MLHVLSDATVKNTLGYLGCPAKAPTLRYLNQLIRSYVHKVPWESVSRIIKRHATPETKDCPRWPEEFWQQALKHGFGGTCYESSLAFYSLLRALGYEGYLTVNDMGTTRGCHAAIVVQIHGRKYLVDITIPIHAAIRIDARKITRRQTPIQDFTVRSVRENVYEVTRSHHPNRSAFTLIDIPVSLPEYQAIVENDYAEMGLFLKSVVMNKVIDGRTTRFFSDHKPYRLERFDRAGKQETVLQAETLPRLLAGMFNMPKAEIAAALSHIAVESDTP